MANKKLTATVALALAMAASTTAFAALPSGTVVIGDKGYTLEYVNDPANADEITAAIVASNGLLYVKGFDGTWFDNADENAAVTSSMIPAITFKGEDGKEVKYNAGEVEAPTTPVENKFEVTTIKAVNPNKVDIAAITEKTEVSQDAVVASNAQLWFTFSKVVNKDTANINTIKLYEVTSTGKVPVGISSVKFNTAETEVRITPATLDKGCDYELDFDKTVAAADASTTVGENGYVFKFSTNEDGVLATNDNGSIAVAYDATTATAITGSNPDLYYTPYFAASAGDGLVLNFDSYIDGSSVSAATVKVKNATSGTYVNVQPTLVTVGNANATTNQAIKINFLDNLSTGKNYLVEINGVKLANGNNLASVNYPFVIKSTAPSITTTGIKTLNSAALGTDSSNPRMVNGRLSNAMLATGEILQPNRFVLYLDSVNDDTVTKDAFSIIKDGETDSIDFDFAYDKTLHQVMITPKADLAEGKLYSFNINEYVIKNALGKYMPKATYYFKTYDVTAPLVENVTGDTVNLAVDKVHTLNIKFSEAVGIMRSSTVDQNFTNVTAGKLTASCPIALVKAGKSLSAPASGDFLPLEESKWDSKTNTLSVSFKPTDRATTYQLVIAGKNSSYAYITDVTNTDADNVKNPLASNYTITFTTEAADTVAPSVAGITLDDTNKTALTEGQTGVSTSYDLLVNFSELLTGTTVKANTVTATAITSTAADGNIVLEKWNDTTSKWVVDNNTTFGAIGGTLSLSVSKDGKSHYVNIPKSMLEKNTQYRIHVFASDNASDTITDLYSNDMPSDYTFTFTTKGNAPDLVTSSSAIQFAQSTVTTGAALNETAIGIGAVTVTNSAIAIEQDNGTWILTTNTAPASSAAKVTLSDALTANVAAGNGFILNQNVKSFATGINPDQPILFEVKGHNAVEKIDINSITNDTVYLKDSQGNKVAATLKVKLDDANHKAYVLIVPNDSLAAKSAYTVVVDGVKDEFGNTATGTYAQKINFTTGTGAVSRLHVDSTNVQDGDTNILTDKTIEINFDTPVTTGAIAGIVVEDITSGTPVDVTTKCYIDFTDTTYKTIMVTPRGFWTKNSIYKVTVPHGTQVATAYGTATMGADSNYDVTVAFQTSTTQIKPKIVSAVVYDINGNNKTDEGDQVIVTFNSPMNSNYVDGFDAAHGTTTTGAFAIGGIGQLTSGTAVTLVGTDADDNTDMKVSFTLGGGDVIVPGVSTITMSGTPVFDDKFDNTFSTTTIVTITKY